MEKIRQESQHTAVPGETMCCKHRASSTPCDFWAGSDLGSPNTSLPCAQAMSPVEAAPSFSCLLSVLLQSIPPSRAVAGQMRCLLLSWPCSAYFSNDWLNFEWWMGQFSRGQATCSASSPSVATLVAKRSGQAPTVFIIISNHNFLEQRSNSLIKPLWTALAFTCEHSSGAGKQLQVVTFLNYRSFIWQWLQIWAVIPTTGNAFFAIGFTWDKGKNQEVWLLDDSKDLPSQNILKKMFGAQEEVLPQRGQLVGNFSSTPSFPPVWALPVIWRTVLSSTRAHSDRQGGMVLIEREQV